MLRIGSKAALRLKNASRLSFSKDGSKTFSSASSSGSSLRTIVITGGIILAGCGGAVAYAKFDSSFRDSVQNSIPGATSILDAVLGPANHLEKRPLRSDPASVDPFERPLQNIKELEKMPIVEEQRVTIEDVEELPGLSEELEAKEEVVVSSFPLMEEDEKETVSVKEEKPSLVDDKSVSLSPSGGESILPNKVNEELMKTPADSSLNNSSELLAPESTNLEVEFTSEDVTTTTESIEVVADVGASAKSISKEEEKDLKEEDATKNFDIVASTAILSDLLSECSVACADAILSSNDAATAVAHHSSLLRTALDDVQASAEEKSLQWTDVGLALIKKQRNLEAADVDHQRAIETLTKIKLVLDQIESSYPQVNEKTIDIKQSCLNMWKDLEDAKSKVVRCKTEANALSEYQHLIEDAKSSLREGLSLPDGKSEDTWRRESAILSQDEEMEILRRLQHRIEQLQRELTEERTKSSDRIERAVDAIRMETEKQVKRDADVAIKKSLQENELLHEEKMAEVSRAHAEELRSRLQQQTAAHAEHLSQALAYMDKQAAAKYEQALKDRVEKQRSDFERASSEERAKFEARIIDIIDQHQVELNIARARVAGIEKAIDGRAHVESETRKAQELSLACDSLRLKMRLGDEGKPLPLAAQLDTVRKVYPDSDVIDMIASSVPAEAAERGVYSEDRIRDWFKEAGKTSRRLSMIDEEHNSLYIYFLSFLKSMLTVSHASSAPPTDVNQSELDVFSIISYANYCLDRNDVEQAVRFVNQLRGESRRAAESWLAEARLLLETKQTVEALCAVANATVLGARLGS
ncbi:MICOS complex subunit Mic60-like [Clavelina lepadiformis]|uniref:MICOS complex subunit Mic60-like n=1 Tax=Clavelina lepadiformis TaxID=159417 RepID=UPI00404317FD